MDLERFKTSGAGRLMRQGQGEGAYWAFVPNPLPPALTFDPELVRGLSDADRALGELAGLGRTVSNPQLLIRPFVRREAVLSSRIEGTQASIADLYAYEAGQTPPPGSDVIEVLNYARAMEYGLERLKTLPVSLRLMCELHERLMAGVRGEQATPGEFRRSQNWIGRPGSTLNDADFVAPAAPEMREALDLFEKYLHSGNQYPPLVRLAFIHYQFEAIHPFLDGNGRIGRLLISVLLADWELLTLPLLYLSAYFEQQRQEYYGHLLAVSEKGSWRDWVFFFLRGVLDQSRDAIARAKRLQDLQRAWRSRLSAKGRAAALLIRLTDSLFESPLITIPQASRFLGVAYHTAQSNVQVLVECGILRQIGETQYGKLFLAGDVLKAVEGSEGENCSFRPQIAILRSRIVLIAIGCA